MTFFNDALKPPPMAGGLVPSLGPQAMSGGLLSAFANNPQFQQQLAAIMQGQGPGMQPPQYRPPLSPVTTTAPTPAAPAKKGGLLSQYIHGAIMPMVR